MEEKMFFKEDLSSTTKSKKEFLKKKFNLSHLIENIWTTSEAEWLRHHLVSSLPKFPVQEL